MQNGKVCLKCGKPKADSAFFKSSSSYHKDGLVPICRKCIIDTVYNPDTDAMDVSSFEEVLQKVDKPFLPKIMNAVDKQIRKQYSNKTGYERVKTAVGLYFKNINSLKQYQDTTYSSPTNENSNKSEELCYYLKSKNSDDTLRSLTMFDTGLEFELMKVLFNLLKLHYSNSDLEVLIFYIQNRIGQELCIAANDFNLHEEFKHDADKFLIQLKESQGKDADIDFADEYADMYLQEDDGE